jgi:hypothetical protein
VVIENSVRAENAKISSACRHSLLEKLIEVSAQQRCNGVLSQSVECREKSGVLRQNWIVQITLTFQ